MIKIIGMLGFVSLALTGLVFLFTPSLLYIRSSLLIISLCAIVFVLLLNFKGVKTFIFKQSTKSTLLSSAFILVTLVSLIALNFIASKYSFRFDFSEGKIHTLSEQSQKIIKMINSEVSVYGFMKEEERTSFNELMKRYQASNPLIKYYFVNPNAELSLTKKYEIKTFGTVVVESENKHLLIEEGLSESALTNTLLKLQLQKIKKVAFLVGHQERSIHDNNISGISQLKATLVGQGYNVTEINLTTSKTIPKDIELIVIAAPKVSFLEREIQILNSFISRNGNVIYLQDPQENLSTPSFISERGIRILNGTIIDPDAAPFSGGAEIPLVGRYGDHDVTKGLKKESLRTLYPIATALKEVRNLDGIKLTPLAFTSPRSWLESRVAQNVKYDENSDLKGPLVLGLISESKGGKIVVFGDSDFASNQFLLLGANKNLLVNAVQYVMDDQERISILPRGTLFHQILLSNSQLQLIRFFAGIFIPFALTFGCIRVWLRRRRL